MARVVAHSGVLTSVDVAGSVAFWIGKLGFSVVETFGSPPEFAILRRDCAYQMIGMARSGPPMLRRDQRSGLMDAYFWVDDAQALHDDLTRSACTFAAPLEKQPYGVIEFMIETPDGHHIAFGQDLQGEIGRES
ncbi:MAG: VOC family protein [Rhizobiales bacterium]|nr:VOC family protein [Hyphomicrobiales bacterium]